MTWAKNTVKAGAKACLGSRYGPATEAYDQMRRCLVRTRQKVRARLRQPNCGICGCRADGHVAYGRLLARCRACGFVFARDVNAANLSEGMGLLGSWSGPGGGGYREYWLARLVRRQVVFPLALTHCFGYRTRVVASR